MFGPLKTSVMRLRASLSTSLMRPSRTDGRFSLPSVARVSALSRVLAGGAAFGAFGIFAAGNSTNSSYKVVPPPRERVALADEMPASGAAEADPIPPPPQPIRQTTTRENLTRQLDQESVALEEAVAEARRLRRRQSRDLSFMRMKPTAKSVSAKSKTGPTSANAGQSSSSDEPSAEETGKLLDEEALELESAIAEEEEHFKLMFSSSCGAEFQKLYVCVKGSGSGPDYETDACKDAVAAVAECVQRHPSEFPDVVCASVQAVK